ncbi:MAG: hypothetical protein ABR506_05070 [Candidatus Krumholzibacteriia bacterium]
MNPCQRFLVLLGVTIAVAGLAGGAAADAVFMAPESVQADGAGHFSFTAVLTAGQDCVGYVGHAYVGQDNVNGSLWADTFCIDPQPVAPGTQYWFTVEGNLIDPGLPGTVWSHSAHCTGGGGEAITTVLAPVVPNDPDSWGSLKSRYR